MPKVVADVADLKKLNKNLQTLAKSTTVFKFALWEGASVAADELRTGVNGLQRVTDAAAIHAWEKLTPSLISVSQKNGLRSGLGVTKIRLRGSIWSVRIGFDGYNSVVTKRWPNGQPNRMIAASCEHGSTAMLEQPFIRPAFQRCEAKIKEAMETKAKEKIEEILNEGLSEEGGSE